MGMVKRSKYMSLVSQKMRENETKVIFEEILTRNSPKLTKDIKPQIQEVLCTSKGKIQKKKKKKQTQAYHSKATRNQRQSHIRGWRKSVYIYKGPLKETQAEDHIKASFQCKNKK